MSEKSEKFPNLHSKTGAGMGMIASMITYAVCESGLLGLLGK